MYLSQFPNVSIVFLIETFERIRVINLDEWKPAFL